MATVLQTFIEDTYAAGPVTASVRPLRDRAQMPGGGDHVGLH